MGSHRTLKPTGLITATSPARCPRCGLASRATGQRFCDACLPVLENALSDVVWRWFVATALLAGIALVGVVLLADRLAGVDASQAITRRTLQAPATSLQWVAVGLLIVAGSATLMALTTVLAHDLPARLGRGNRVGPASQADRQLARRHRRTLVRELRAFRQRNRRAKRLRESQRRYAHAPAPDPAPAQPVCPPLTNSSPHPPDVSAEPETPTTSTGSAASARPQATEPLTPSSSPAGPSVAWTPAGQVVGDLKRTVRKLGTIFAQMARQVGLGVRRSLSLAGRIARATATLAGRGLVTTARPVYRGGDLLVTLCERGVVIVARALGGSLSVLGSGMARAVKVCEPALAGGVVRCLQGRGRIVRAVGKAAWAAGGRAGRALQAQAGGAARVAGTAATRVGAFLRRDRSAPTAATAKSSRARPAGSLVAQALEGWVDSPAPADPDLAPQLTCPACGRVRPHPGPGRYVCSQCEAKLIVDETSAMLLACCPGCGKTRPVAAGGRFACGDCGVVFVIDGEGTRPQATCPGCGRSRLVDGLGPFRCSQCDTVFSVEGRLGDRPEPFRQTEAAASAGRVRGGTYVVDASTESSPAKPAIRR